MIRREQLSNKLRQLGYAYKRETERVQLWKRKDDHHFVSLKKSATLDDDYARSVLRQCGCGDQDIETFLGNCHS